jgi:hypothetical protein
MNAYTYHEAISFVLALPFANLPSDIVSIPASFGSLLKEAGLLFSRAIGGRFSTRVRQLVDNGYMLRSVVDGLLAVREEEAQ